MWSKSKKSRFDLTLNGRNVVKERTPTLSVHTAPGRGYNSRQLKYIDIRDLLHGSYAPSWRLEKSRDVSSTAKLDPLPAPRDVDRINDFLSKSADPRLERNLSHAGGSRTGTGSVLSVSGAMYRGGGRLETAHPALSPRVALGPAPPATPRVPEMLRQDLRMRTPINGRHDTLEEEYRALRDLTRTDPRSVDTSMEYINFVEPKPLHSHSSSTADEDMVYVNVEGEGEDVEEEEEYYGELDSFTETVDPLASQASSPGPRDNPTQEDNPGQPSISGQPADVLVIGEDYAPSLSPIVETEGLLKGGTFHGNPGEGDILQGEGVVIEEVEEDEEEGMSTDCEVEEEMLEDD